MNIVARFDPEMVGIFDSYTRGENSLNSDLDVLIDFKHSPDLLEVVGLEQKLSEPLGTKVALVTLRSLNPQLKEYIEKDLVLLIP